MAAREEAGRQLAVVVDLPVEDHPDRAVFVGDWLVPRLEVDDAEAPHPKPHAGLRVDTPLVRAAMDQRLSHGAEHTQAFRPGLVPTDTEDAAHARRRPSRPRGR